MGLYRNPSVAIRFRPLRRATTCAGLRTALMVAVALTLGIPTAQSGPARFENPLEPIGPQVTISWSVVVHQPGTVLRIYRGPVGGPMKVIVERETAAGRIDESWIDQVVTAGVMVYQLRYVNEDGDEVILGTRFGAVGAMQEAPRSVSTQSDNVVADLARATGLDVPQVAGSPGLRDVLGDLFRPRPPDPVPRFEPT